VTDADALAILEDAHRRCGTEDMRTAAVYSALQCRERSASERWPFDQFRHALGSGPFSPDAAGRGQVVNASLNGIRRVCRITTPRPSRA
jgi:hypothetical protein